MRQIVIVLHLTLTLTCWCVVALNRYSFFDRCHWSSSRCAGVVAVSLGAVCWGWLGCYSSSVAAKQESVLIFFCNPP